MTLGSGGTCQYEVVHIWWHMYTNGGTQGFTAVFMVVNIIIWWHVKYPGYMVVPDGQ
jgi:hypothetical protein